MQTFLPYPDFKKSAECLDYRRLGNQRKEAHQIILALMQGEKVVYNQYTKVYYWRMPIDDCLSSCEVVDTPWYNHPAVQMWKGYLVALIEYYNTIVKEWISRGYVNNMLLIGCPGVLEYPPWFGNKEFHDAHKSKLLQKDYDFYKKYNWDVPLDLKYIWG